MTTKSSLAPLGLATLLASLSLCNGGCAANKPPVPAQRVTSADLAPRPPAPPPVPMVMVSSNVTVSNELAAACKLRFDDVKIAPKFDFDRSKLGPDDNEILAQIAQCVTAGPLKGRALDLVGRADPRGKQDYNMALGERRAGSVGAYLTGLGVESGSLVERSRGELDARGTDESGWQLDRRVDILLR